jgi:hypothetical protein
VIFIPLTIIKSLSYGRFRGTLFFRMAEQQRCVIEFCVWLGKRGSVILQLIHHAYGDDAMKRAAVFKWWKRFRDGGTNMKDELRSSRPSTAPVPLPS